MKKILKNSGTSYITIRSIDLTLGPGESHTLTDLEKIEWADDSELLTYVRSGAIQVGYWENSFYTNEEEGEIWLRTPNSGGFTIEDSTSIVELQNAIVEDSTTGVKSTALLANLLLMMRELYNNTDNPFYSASFQQFIGTGGREVEHLARTLNLETIHNKLGWHQQEIIKTEYKSPKNLLIYYGYLNSFNSGTNGWDNEKVAQDMSKYSIIVIGNGIQHPAHADYTNTQIIIPRIKALNPDCLIFGYMDGTLSLSTFQSYVDEWETLQVHGIFIDQAGYDFGTTTTNSRTAMNIKIDYIHSKTNAKLVFMNAWNMDHIIGTTDDASYPNTTWNSTLTESTLSGNDWYLLESFPVNSDSYTSTYIETASEWYSRGNKAITHRQTYGINLAAVGIIGNTLSYNVGQSLFDFLYVSSLMYSLDAVGSSDSSYAASSVTVTYWMRREIGNIQIYDFNPTITVDTTDSNIYRRFINEAILVINFNSTVKTGYIYKEYDQYIANRKMNYSMDSYACQPFLGRQKVGWWNPIGGATTAPLALGIAAPSATGTATARAFATTNMFTSTRRLGYVGSSTAGSSAGPRLAVLQFWRGNAAGLGGFMLSVKFGISDAATVAGARMFVGMCGVTTALTSAEPSTFTNIIGMGYDSTQTTFRILYNDSSGTASSIDLGANFPTQTLSVDLYELILYCKPYDSYIYYRVERLNTGHVANGTLSTDIPASTQLLAPQLWRNNGTTALAVGIDLVNLYIETER